MLEKRQYEKLKARARREDKSLSELIRLAVDRFLGLEKAGPSSGNLKAIRALGSDPGGPSGREHDKTLYGPTS